MAAFRSEELAIRLGTPNDVEDHAYALLIYCAEISGLRPADCSGTHATKILTGAGKHERENLTKLQEALEESLQYVRQRLAES